MLIILLCLLAQDTVTFTPETINAQLFIDGKQLDLTDVRIKGVQPYAFEFRTGDGSSLISLYQVARISRVPDGRDYKILFLSGEEKEGRIRSFSITANPDINSGKRQSWLLQNIERIHLVQGKQLRSCAQGHYEELTPYPYCPVCGNELELGPYHELEQAQPSVWPFNTLRQDSRDPSSTATRR